MTLKQERKKEFDKLLAKFSPEEKEFLKDKGVGSYEQVKEAIWKHTERLNPEKRELHYGKYIQALSSNDIEEREIAIKEWKRIYGSFTQSKEWKEFRKRFLLLNFKCKSRGCKRRATTPHHIIPAYKTFIEKGFLEPSKDFNNFKALCSECHMKEEGKL